MKRCPDCGQTKSEEYFPRNHRTRDGRAVYCKPCHNERGRRSKTKWGGSRYYHLRRRYGITRAEFDLLWRAQNGLCAVCMVDPATHVDHDHTTGQVRGLLCFNCNGGLGQFKEDTLRLALAIGYLQRAKVSTSEGGE